MIICFDLETTGLDKQIDEIIEIAMIKFDENNFKIIETFSTFVNPGIKIPEIISNITNIFDSDVAFSPSFNDIKNDIKNFIGDSVLLGHNVFFDRDFLIEKGIDISNNIVLDTFFLANFLNFGEASLNLEYLCIHYNIELVGPHRAINDTKATILLFEKLIDKFNKLDKLKKNLLYYIINKSSNNNIIFLKNLLFKKNNIKNYNNEEFKATILANLKKYNENENIKIDMVLDTNDIQEVFYKMGNLEFRKNQEKMMSCVQTNLKEKGKLVIEAPTGLGKSYAYLLPSILHSISTGEKVFISTKTKTLQDQLFFKDINYLSKNLNTSFNYTKLKGKKNYLSLNRLFNEIDFLNFEYDKVSFFAKIILWILGTEFGELDEINFYGKEYSFVKDINSDFILLNSKDNPIYEYEFLYKARQNLNHSNIIIINHSLLFSDIKSSNSILGNIDNLIIDEAHNIEDSLTDSLKVSTNIKNFLDLFDRIESIFSNNNINKVNFINKKDELMSKIELIFDYSFSYLNSKSKEENYYKNCLINSDFFTGVDFQDINKKIQDDFLFIVDILSIIPEYNFTSEISLLTELVDVIKIILDTKTEKHIKIIGFIQNQGIILEYTLLNPGEFLSESLYNKVNSILLTSATLKIGEDFNYIKQTLALNDFSFISFESDFDYKRQSTLFIPSDLGNIKNNTDNIINFLYEFYKIVGGNTLTLFTSFNIIKKVYIGLNQDLKKLGVNLYAQSIGGSKIKLIDFFLNSPGNSILLGTDSFWEGVDIPGNNLKYLIIHKFPFQVPTDPIFQSRSKLFIDPFLEYSVPKAIIKLKQGFGRLIRNKTDTGIVILLDDRIHNYSWGSEFYKAFPFDINIKKGNSNDFLNILKNKV